MPPLEEAGGPGGRACRGPAEPARQRRVMTPRACQVSEGEIEALMKINVPSLTGVSWNDTEGVVERFVGFLPGGAEDSAAERDLHDPRAEEHPRAFCGRCEDACEHLIGSVLLYVAAKRRKLSSPVNAVITCMGKHDSSPTQSSPEMATPVSDSDDTKTAQDRLREKREEAEALVQSETDVMSLWGCSLQSASAASASASVPRRDDPTFFVLGSSQEDQAHTPLYSML